MTATTHDSTRAQARLLQRVLLAGLFVVGCEAVGILGAATTMTGESPWYQDLVKPSFQPPGWLFGPVWTALYAMMGVAAYRVFELRRRESKAGRALGLFALQLALNAIWSPVFFGAQAIGVALAVIIALWLVLLVTLWAFWRLDRLAGSLLVPYQAWVTFATVLNASIVALN